MLHAARSSSGIGGVSCRRPTAVRKPALASWIDVVAPGTAKGPSRISKAIADSGLTEVTRSRIGVRPLGWQTTSEPSAKSPVTPGSTRRVHKKGSYPNR